ncbi:MAG TPA: hypothetical protein VFT37_08490 [Telluria sp.]|nr:hypothetical protein [Telluria sp.]
MHDIDNADDESSDLFWLVVADQFERRGIDSPLAYAAALSVLASGRDLTRLRDDVDVTPKFVAKRAAVLEDLEARLRAPRPSRPAVAAKDPPAFILDVGEVYAFPIMNGRAHSPHRPAQDGPFVQDGWGAMIVLDRQRAFDWLPWYCAAGLTIDAQRRPTMRDAEQACITTSMHSEGANGYNASKAHLRLMQVELIGRVALDPAKVAPHMSKRAFHSAIEYGWTIAYAKDGLRVGAALSSLLSSAPA